MKKIYSFFFAAILSVSSLAQVDFAIGSTVPNFTVTDLEGNSHTLYDYTAAGKYVLVDFFAYWCGPCMQYAPFVNEFYHKYGCNQGSVIVIGVEYEGTDAQTHGFEEAAGIDDENPFPVASGIGGGGAAVHTAYGAAAFPTYIAINPSNVLLDNDIWPLGNNPLATLEAAFPAAALVEMDCAVSVAASSDENSFELMPNPADDVVYLNAELMAQINVLTISIYDMAGKMLSTETLSNLPAGNNRFKLNTAALATGVYQMHVTSGDSVLHSEKLFKR